VGLTEIVRIAGLSGEVVLLLREAETQVALSVTRLIATLEGLVILYGAGDGTEPPI
jgi:hypothetical protein